MVLTRRASEADYIFVPREYSDEIRVLSFRGDEGISEPFRYNLRLAALDSEIDFETIVGKPAYLRIYGEAGDRYVNGIVTRFTQAGIGNRYATYNAELRPFLWLLTMRNDCRIFQNMSVQDIITEVFQDAEIQSDNYRFALEGTHNPREYCVQYRESDFNFISRLMEEEGIFYFFEHSEESHVMVIADSSSVHVPIESPNTIVFNEPSGMVPREECVYSYRFAQQMRSGSVSLRDFNFERPTMGMDVLSMSGAGDEAFEVYDYPGNYMDPNLGSNLSVLRLDAIRFNRQMGYGESVCRRFIPGYKFTLDGYQRADFNQEYLITRVINHGSQPLGEDSAGPGFIYRNEFECIPSSVPYRPVMKTQKPVLEGIQTAIVVGPSGEKIYTDNYGRVKVQFHWDREGQMDEDSSCWVRVSNGYAGLKHGIEFIPLIGDEVVVDFLEGDPDRPIITGRVYNGDNMPPLKPEGMIKNIILTPYQHRLLFDDKSTNITLNTGGKEILRMTDGDKSESDYGNNINISTADGHFMLLAEGTKGQGIMISTYKGNFIILDDKNENITIQTTNGHIALLDDQNKKIQIQSADAHKITIDDQGQNITVVDSSGQHKIEINMGAQKITISTDSGSIDMLAPAGTVAIKASQVEIEATMDLKMKGLNISEEATMEMKTKGLNVTTEAGVQHSTKGVMVSSEASAMNTIKGGLVQIN